MNQSRDQIQSKVRSLSNFQLSDLLNINLRGANMCLNCHCYCLANIRVALELHATKFHVLFILCSGFATRGQGRGNSAIAFGNSSFGDEYFASQVQKNTGRCKGTDKKFFFIYYSIKID